MKFRPERYHSRSSPRASCDTPETAASLDSSLRSVLPGVGPSFAHWGEASFTDRSWTDSCWGECSTDSATQSHTCYSYAPRRQRQSSGVFESHTDWSVFVSSIRHIQMVPSAPCSGARIDHSPRSDSVRRDCVTGNSTVLMTATSHTSGDTKTSNIVVPEAVRILTRVKPLNTATRRCQTDLVSGCQPAHHAPKIPPCIVQIRI